MAQEGVSLVTGTENVTSNDTGTLSPGNGSNIT